MSVDTKKIDRNTLDGASIQGTLNAIQGTMWSGKTTKAIEIAKKYEKKSSQVFIVDQFNLRDSERDLRNAVKKRGYIALKFNYENPNVDATNQIAVMSFLGKVLGDGLMNARDERNHEFFRDSYAGKILETENGNATGLDCVCNSIAKYHNGIGKKPLIIFDEIHLIPKCFLCSFAAVVLTLKSYSFDVILVGLQIDCYNSFNVFRVWNIIAPFLDNVTIMPSRIPCKTCEKNEDTFYIGTVLTRPTQNNSENKIGDGYANQCLVCFSKGELCK